MSKTMRSFLGFLILSIFITGCSIEGQGKVKIIKHKASVKLIAINIPKVEKENCIDTSSIPPVIIVKPPVVPVINNQTTTVINKAKGERIIVIDPGHGNPRNSGTEELAPGVPTMMMVDGGGTAGIVTHTPEYRVNLNVGLKLRDILVGKGYTVIMTKTQDSEGPTNRQRAEVGNKAGADLEIRVHCDGNANTGLTGASMQLPGTKYHTQAMHDESSSYGKTILNTLTSQVGILNKGVNYRDDLIGFNWATVPTILVEMGFMSNAKEDKQLSDVNYQTRLAKSLGDGIFIALPIN
ncbi:MAG TPA: N-acetylmuramoyl-L-alanine amidase [Clostridiaceae bacterium]